MKILRLNGVHAKHNALRTKGSRSLPYKSVVFDCKGVDGDFLRARKQYLRHIREG